MNIYVQLNALKINVLVELGNSKKYEGCACLDGPLQSLVKCYTFGREFLFCH